MIYLCTATTEDYPWADAFAESVRRNTGPGTEGVAHLREASEDRRRPGGLALYTAPVFFSVGHNRTGFRSLPVDMANNRCKSLQHGSFLDDLSSVPTGLRASDVVIFTDCDMVMQRPFAYDELYDFQFMAPDTVFLGVNGKAGDTLLDEARLLFSQEGESLSEVARHNLAWHFPGFEKIPVWNCGVIVTRVETYRRLHDMARALLPVVESWFEHYAAIQWCLCYCIGKWLRHELLPRTIHVHGHFGLPEECAVDEGGNVMVKLGPADGVIEGARLAVFRHAINLTPAKGINVGADGKVEWVQ